MKYKANCDPTTVGSFLRMIEEAERQIEVAQAKKDALMRMLKVESGKTFMYDGQIYQICERYNKARDVKVPFFKRLKDWPVSHLGKEARAKRVPQVRAPEESAGIDVVEHLSSDPQSLNTGDMETLGEGASPAVVVID